MEKNNVGVIILAAGEGKRMHSDVPKVLHKLKGKPLIEYVVDAVEKAKICDKPIVVVSPENNEAIKKYLGDRVEYVVQEKQLGTGHAVAAAEKFLDGKATEIIVLYGDMPFIPKEWIEGLATEHLRNKGILTLIVIGVPSFKNEYRPFFDYGRVIRDPQGGAIVKVIERRDATPEQISIKELNSGIFCFEAAWLWRSLKLLQNDNAQGEYYLTDLIEVARREKQTVGFISELAMRASGVNTPEDLQLLQNINLNQAND